MGTLMKNRIFYQFFIGSIGLIAILSIMIIPQTVYGKEQSKKLNNKFVVDSGPNKGEKVKVYDGTIEKYNGYYYVMGTGSLGNVYRSKDMIHWESPYEFISSDPNTLPPYAENDYTEFGASDLFFHNGVMFYGFNSSNLMHGDPSSMHTIPDFRHSFWEEKYDMGIDVQFFVAPNGELLYLRKVNPFEADPNTGEERSFDASAWMWKVESFFNERGNPGRSTGKELIHTQKGHWASFDKFNFEGPEMYYQNGQYYLLYMGNNMAPRTGLYETGVAQADHYNHFDNSTKYPGKLIARNLERMLLDYDVILPTAEHGWQNYQYTFTEPEGDWKKVNYIASDWSTGKGGFGYPLTEREVLIPSIYNDEKTKQSEIWGSPEGPQNLWVRRTFHLESIPETVALRHRLEGYGKIYINGQEIHQQQGQQRSYEMVEVPDTVLQKGENVITAEVSTNGSKLNFYHLDFGLYDTNGQAVEADIVGPTQPNVIKGPNGFETWVTYKGLWDGDNGQGKDRVYLWGDEMVVDGPTSENSPDQHFDAWQPTFNDRFDTSDSLDNYSDSQGVSIKNDSLYFNTPNKLKEILLKDYKLKNFFLEINIRFDDKDSGNQGRAGVTVWHKDKNNFVRLFIDRDDLTYIVSSTINGETTTEEHPLPETFEFLHKDDRAKDFGEQYHPLKVYKNGSKLFAELDHYKLNNDKPVLELEEMSTPGKVGLVCNGAKCSMDNLSLTVGWSEYGNYFNDWNKDWKVSNKGITSPSKAESLTVKGDPMREHEFSVNIDTGSLPKSGKTGVILEYVDDQNYVVAYTNYATNQFEIHQVVNGKAELLETASTARDTIYGHSNFDEGLEQTEYVYDLRAPAEVSQAKILWLHGKFELINWIDEFYTLPDVDSQNFGMDNWNATEDKWSPIEYVYDGKGRGDYHVASFNNTLMTDRIRLKVPSTSNRPFSLALREEISAQNFYKTVRTDGRIYLWVNNKLIFDIKDPFKNRPAQVGFYTDGAEATYNSFTGFDISVHPHDGKEDINTSDMLSTLESHQEDLSEQVYRALSTHLISVGHYEKQQNAKKIVKHMEGFKQLINHQKDNQFISKKLHGILEADADSIILKWQGEK